MDDSDNIYDKPLSVNDYVIIYTDKFIVGEISDIDSYAKKYLCTHIYKNNKIKKIWCFIQ